MLPQCRCQSTIPLQCSRIRNSQIQLRASGRAWKVWTKTPSQRSNTRLPSSRRPQTAIIRTGASMLSFFTIRSFSTNPSRIQVVKVIKTKPKHTTWSRNSWKNELHHSLKVKSSSKCRIEHSHRTSRHLVNSLYRELDHQPWLTTSLLSRQLHSLLQVTVRKQASRAIKVRSPPKETAIRNSTLVTTSIQDP